MTSKTTPVRRVPRRDYAEEINEAHAQAVAAAESAIDNAIRCGELLAAQKRRCKHGEFQAWVQEHCTFSHDTANVYMRAARKKTSGLVFSSLRQMIEYERVAKGRPRVEWRSFLRPNFELPEGHDPEAWSRFRQVAEQIKWFAGIVRDLDAEAIVLGALPQERDTLRKYLNGISYSIEALRDAEVRVRRGLPLASLSPEQLEPNEATDPLTTTWTGTQDAIHRTATPERQSHVHPPTASP